MPVNPYVKGGLDVPVVDGGTGASTASGARTNLMALDEAAHDLLDHTGLSGVGDLTAAAHLLIDHGPLTHSRLNIGTATEAVATGDLAAGDGTRTLFYDASAGVLVVSRTNPAIAVPLGGESFHAVAEAGTGSNYVVFSNSSYGIANFRRFRGTVAAPLLVQAGDVLGEFAAQGAWANSDTGAVNTGASIRVVAESIWSNPSTRADIQFATVSTNTSPVHRWSIKADGHFLAASDNAYDIGASGATRPRTGYFGTALNVGNGITPSTSNGDIVAGDGTGSMTFDASTGNFTVDRNIDAVVTAFVRNDNAGTTSYTRMMVVNSTASGELSIAPAANTSLGGNTLPTGVTGPCTRILASSACNGLVLTTNTATGRGVIIQTNGGVNGYDGKWEFQRTGEFVAFLDNSFDIGLSGALRPRTGYFGTSLNVGTGITPSTANGDAVFGDGTRSLLFVASTGEERLTSGFLNVGSNAATFNAGPASASGGLYASNNVNGYVYYHPTASQLICHYYDNGTNNVGTSFSISHGTSATPVAGFGVGFFFEGMSSTRVNRAMGSHECVWTTATDASRTADMVFKVSKEPDGVGNTLEAGRFRGSDLSLKVTNRGDFGTALNVGTGITPSADNGDIVAGDGTRSLRFDASAGSLVLAGGNSFGVGGVAGENTQVLYATTVVDFSVSGTATGLIPAGALVLGVTGRILTLVSGGGATDVEVGDGVDPNRWGNFGGLTAGLTSGPTTYGDNTVQFNNSASAADVVLTGTGGTPTAGTVRVTLAYMLFTAPTS